jgi:hypothetical protein
MFQLSFECPPTATTSHPEVLTSRADCTIDESKMGGVAVVVAAPA